MILRKYLCLSIFVIGLCYVRADESPPTVVQGILVPDNADQIPAEHRSDDEGGILLNEADDQVAVESIVHAEKRDGVAHSQNNAVSHPDNFGDSYSAPKPAESAPTASYSAAKSVSSVESYAAPPPKDDSYGSPQAPVVSDDGYGAPVSAPLGNNYVEAGPSGPIPVPFPVLVKPSSIVLPQDPNQQYQAKPQTSYTRPQQPQYKPRPRPPKRPSYRAQPQKRPPQPRPQYKPRPSNPPKPVYKQKPIYKPRPPAQPKPQYKPPTRTPPKPQQKPSYKPPTKPAYKPPTKPSYKSPSKPAYKPPTKPLYKPPSKPAYKPPSKPSYKPASKPVYKPPSKPAYKPKPTYNKPNKPSYRPPAKVVHNAKPQYSPAPKAPIPTKQTAHPNSIAASYAQPSTDEAWPKAQPKMPKITSLDVTCEKNLMKVFIEFDKPFFGIIFSKGHYSDVNCIHLPAGLGRKNAKFDVSINSCGTTGNTDNGLYGYGSDSGSGTFFENTIVVQYDPQVQEVWDQARKLRCTWHDQYEKSVTFRPFPVDVLDVVRADFAGDNVGCWMQIQVGKGPWASEVSGLVKIGQTMTMVLAIKDEEQKFDMMVRNCMAHDGNRAPIQLVDTKGCVTRPKLMSKFSKIKNFGASASVLSYAHFQAFKFPDSMEVHFQCTIQICRYQCPDQCPSNAETTQKSNSPGNGDSYGSPLSPVVNQYSAPSNVSPLPSYSGNRRARRAADSLEIELEDVGVQKVIQVVSSDDLTFAIKESENDSTVLDIFPPVSHKFKGDAGYICMTTPAFATSLIVLLSILLFSCILSAFLCLKHRSYYGESSLIAAFANPVFAHKKGHY